MAVATASEPRGEFERDERKKELFVAATPAGKRIIRGQENRRPPAADRAVRRSHTFPSTTARGRPAGSVRYRRERGPTCRWLPRKPPWSRRDRSADDSRFGPGFGPGARFNPWVRPSIPTFSIRTSTRPSSPTPRRTFRSCRCWPRRLFCRSLPPSCRPSCGSRSDKSPIP